jgi:hypothetical protein
MAEKGVEFGVLGPLQVCVDGAPVPLGTPKQRAVLAMLLISIPTCPTSASCWAVSESTPVLRWERSAGVPVERSRK